MFIPLKNMKRIMLIKINVIWIFFGQPFFTYWILLTQILLLSTEEDLRLMAEIFTVNKPRTGNQRCFNNNKDETAS